MIDVKKLISGFLILAAAAVGSGFILSFAGNFTSSKTDQTAGPTIVGINNTLNTPATLGGANAFVDTGSLQGNAAEMLSDITSTSTAAAAIDPNNLTNTFADSFLNGLVAANPDGASVDSSGNPNFNAPNTQAVAMALSSDPTFQNFKTPNWDAEAQLQAIKTIPTASQDDITQYNNSLNAIFEKYFVATNLENVVNSQNGDPTQAAYINSQLQGALGELSNVKTPTSFAGFQKSLVKVMVYEKNSTEIAQNANIDPIKTALIMQGEQSKYSAALSDLSSQMKKASAQGLSLGSTTNTKTSFIASILGVQTAHAQWITFDPSAFGQLLLQYLNDTILQILKNVLVQLIQQKVLTWIQGSGAPRFVTDFGSQLVNSFQVAASNSIDNLVTTCLPSYQAPMVKMLISTPAVAQKSSCLEQFNGQLNNNLQNFYNNFGTNLTNYVSLFQPGGNVWSLSVQVRDAAVTTGSQSAQAKQTQTVAQQGWKGSVVCSDGSNPDNGTHYTCPDGGTLNGNMCDMDSGLLSENAILQQNGGTCADGSTPKTTSPGQVTGQGFFSSLKSGAENITSANNIAGILNALLSSLLNSLAQSAINYSTQALNGALSGSGGGSDSGVVGTTLTSSSTPQAGVQCLPSVSPVIMSTSTKMGAATLSAGGGSIDTACAEKHNCPTTENSDGTPHYSWLAPGSLEAANGNVLSGSSLAFTYSATGTYFVTVTASTDNSTSTCEIDVQ